MSDWAVPDWSEIATGPHSALPDLWDGLLGLWCPTLGPQPSQVLDLCGRKNHLTIFGATPLITPAGRAMGLTASTHYLLTQQSRAASTRWTITAAWWQNGSFSFDANARLWDIDDTNRLLGAAVNTISLHVAGSYIYTNQNIGLALNACNVLSISADGANAATYCNAHLIRSDACAGSLVAGTVMFGCSKTAARTLNASFLLLAIHNRPLPAPLIIEWQADPFAVIRPRPALLPGWTLLPLVSLLRSRARPPARQRRGQARSIAEVRGRFYLDGRGKYRVFNAAEYRFYRSSVAPPEEGDEPFATNATLPYTPDDLYADGTWYLSVSWFNGVLDSGFLPIGPAGETYLRLEISAGEDIENPPAAPLDVRIESVTGGVVRIVACYFERDAALRATQWAVAYTTNGADPPADDPDISGEMPASGLAVLDYELPAQADETTVKVRVQTRRNDGTIGAPVWRYSQGSTVLTIAADAAGPAAAEIAHLREITWIPECR